MKLSMYIKATAKVRNILILLSWLNGFNMLNKQ